MVRRHISDELKEVALFMSLWGFPDSEVRDLTGISARFLRAKGISHFNSSQGTLHF